MDEPLDKILLFLNMLEMSANDPFDCHLNRVCRVLSKTWQFREAREAAYQMKKTVDPLGLFDSEGWEDFVGMVKHSVEAGMGWLTHEEDKQEGG
jgi:hypothetical protein